MKNILLAVDLQESDQTLISHAAAIAEKFGSRIWIIHVAAPDPDFVGYGVGPTYVREMRADELRKEHRLLQEYAVRLNTRKINTEALLIQGPTIEMIRDEARKLSIDLLVLGSHKHSFLYEAFVGRTEIRLIKESTVPVLIIPLDEDES